MQLDFWNNFREYGQEKKTKLRLRKGNPQHWYDISLGNSESHICLTINTQTDQLGCELYISDSKDLFHELEKRKTEIEEELNEKLDWMELPGKKASRIKLQTDADLGDSNQWPNHYEWLKTRAEKFHKVFSKNINQIRG